MMRIVGIVLCLLCYWSTSFAALDTASRNAIRITELAVTTKIVRGNPIDSVHRISAASVKSLYCFTRIHRKEGGETTIKHVWHRDGQVVGEVTLPVKGENWRTYSQRPIDLTSKGMWRVDVLSADGTLLKTVEFRIN